MSSGPLLLDTCILLALVRDKDLGKQISSLFNLKGAVHRPLISIVTVGEIWSLADQFGFGEDKRDFLKKVLETLVISISIMSRSWMHMSRLTERAERRKVAPKFCQRTTSGSLRLQRPPVPYS